MIIADNMLANGAARQLKIIGNNKKKPTERLSSGYRINRASDDAAGLSISEKMRGQIRGLTQGVRNVEDGISLCQVADGALSEVTSMLQRITELSVQSANDTNTDEDRNAIQNEIGELLEEIDRIGETTSFNERNLFQGDNRKIIGYRPETVTNTINVPMTDSFTFSVSGESSDNTAKTYTISSASSLSTGIVIGADTITWNQVKDQNGDAINLNNTITAGDYSFEYKGMKVSFNTGRDVNAEQFLTGLTGLKWSTKTGPTDQTMHYYIYVKSSEKDYGLDGTYHAYSINAKEDGLYVKKTGQDWERYDWPSSLVGTPTIGTTSFQAGGLAFDFIISENNTAPFSKIVEHIGLRSLYGDCTRTDSPIPVISSIELTDNHNANNTCNWHEIEQMIYPVRSFIMTNNDGMWLNLWGNETTKVSWDDLFNNSTREGNTTRLTYQTNDVEISFNVLNSIIDNTDFRKIDLANALAQHPIIVSYEQIGENAYTYSLDVDPVSASSPLKSSRLYSESSFKEMANRSINTILADSITEVPEYSYTTTRDEETIVQVPIYDESTNSNDGKIWIQYGANSGQALQLEIDKISTTELGINGLDVTTRDGASNAISLSQQAVLKVTESRSKIGSYQNRMEHIVDNENNMIENTQAAESRIRDSDMAKEMVDLAKQQILEQVGTSMITQANQNTQGILKLLQ